MADVNGPTTLPNGQAPNCKLSFGQNLASTYNNSCGWCDYKGMCKTQGYCNECCTNLNNPAVYNGCRLMVKSVTEINNHTGAVIDIPQSSTVQLSANKQEMVVANQSGVEFKIYKMGGTVNWVKSPTLILLMI